MTMEKGRDHLSETRPKAGGIARDLDRLKSDGAASVAEIREFLGEMRGRSPQEMLGLVAESDLTRSMFLATGLFVLLLAVLTVVPYALKPGGADASARGAVQESAEAAGGEEDAPPASAEPPAEPAEAEAAPNDAAETDPERAVDAMGIGETRVAAPDENPLEDKLDKLLDGIE
jgi:hypothetical protein